MPLLINLLILCVVAAVVYWIWTLLPLPQPIKNIVLCILLLILLLVVLSYTPLFSSGIWGRWGR
jgi:hypothetical protein